MQSKIVTVQLTKTGTIVKGRMRLVMKSIMSTLLKILAGKGGKMQNVRVHFKKWEPVGKMERYNSKMRTMEEYNSRNGCRYKIVLVQF